MIDYKILSIPNTYMNQNTMTSLKLITIGVRVACLSSALFWTFEITFDNYTFGFRYVHRPWTCSKDRPSNKRERRGKNLDDGEFCHFILKEKVFSYYASLSIDSPVSPVILRTVSLQVQWSCPGLLISF